MPNFSSPVMAYLVFIICDTGTTFEDHWTISMGGSGCLMNISMEYHLGNKLINSVYLGREGFQSLVSKLDDSPVCLE